MQYERLVVSIAKGEKNFTINSLADELLKKYAYTPYDSLADLQLAKLAVNQNNLMEAANRLVSIIDHDYDQALQSIARLRLARILLSQTQAKEALNLLSKNEDRLIFQCFWRGRETFLII